MAVTISCDRTPRLYQLPWGSMKSNAECRAIVRTSCLAVTDWDDRPDGLCTSIAAFPRLPEHDASPHSTRVLTVATRQFLRDGYTIASVAEIFLDGVARRNDPPVGA